MFLLEIVVIKEQFLRISNARSPKFLPRIQRES